MTKLKLKTIKINEPMMLFWSLIPLVVLIVSTNYIFNSGSQVLGTNIEDSQDTVSDTTQIFESIKVENQKFKLQRKGVVSILFAGSYKSQFELGYPLIKENHMVASVSAPSAAISSIPSKMTWLNLQLLQHQGWEVVSQSKDQICDVDKLKDKTVIETEIVESKEELNKHGLYVNSYVPPCGISNQEIISKVRANYKSFINFGIVNNQIPVSNKYNLVARTASNDVNLDDVKNWIKEAGIKNEWLILVIPEISDDNNNFSISEENLKNIVDYISKSEVQVTTIGQILKY